MILVYLIIWGSFGLASAAVAINRGASKWTWFMLGVLLGPLGFAASFLSGPKKVDCPFCKSKIHHYALVCPNCQKKIVETDEEIEPEVREETYRDKIDKLLKKGRIDKAESFLISLDIDSWDILDEHYFLQNIALLFYRSRDESPKSLKLAIAYWQKNIDLIRENNEEFLDYFEEMHFVNYRGFPEVYCFKRLAIIHEKQGNIEKAIAICEQALSLGVQLDGTQSGYKGRLAKLKKKLNK